jgi:hypothetical protein
MRRRDIAPEKPFAGGVRRWRPGAAGLTGRATSDHAAEFPPARVHRVASARRRRRGALAPLGAARPVRDGAMTDFAERSSFKRI